MSNARSLAAPDSWAEVRAHGRVMRYRRAGAGRTLLVLHPGECGDAAARELLDALASRFRLIVPHLQDASDELPAWLADLLEGLGYPEVGVVALGCLALPAIELALLDTGLVDRMVLLSDGRSGEHDLETTLESAARRGAVPLLTLRLDVPTAQLIPRLVAFLTE